VSDGIYSALSGAVAQERTLEVVANNVANVGTTGFRGDRVTFAESLTRATETPGVPTSIRYVTVDRLMVDESGGPVRQTGNPLDLAISGEGYFAVSTDRGERYTRDGRFMVDTGGTVRSMDGHPLLSVGSDGRAGPPITIPPGTTSITVGTDGTISAGEQTFGRARIVDIDGAALRHEGASLFTTDGAVRESAAPTVLSGWLEGANVGPIAGMNELIATTRTFEAFQRVIQGFRDIDTRTARDLGST
jgi:flagellar basal-body rod protein FlgF